MNLGFLTPLLHQPGPWASVYFNTSEIAEDAVEQLHLQARAAGDQLAAQGADQATCRAVYETLSDLDREEAGHAVFASGGRVVLDVPLTAAPPSPPISEWAPLPRLGPMLDFGERRPPTLIATIDRKGADVSFHGSHGRTHPVDEVRGQDWPIHRTGKADWSERHFQLSVENTWEENAALIAKALADDAAAKGAELLVLAGDARERRAVHDKLPQPLRAITVETEHGARAAGSDAGLLAASVDDARIRTGERHTADLLDRFLAGRVATDEREVDAVEGVPALVDAAREHRIDTLLVRLGGPDLHRDVWVGDDPDQLSARRSESKYLGDPSPVAARADDALLRSVAATDAEVVVLVDESAELPAGGMGALLRWPYRDGVPDGGHRPPG
ncbi:Vms1/Ankzf1 family peptidyl-tRNA hydrolase [Streptomyces sp. NBRC 109706]|uniref:baeRF2 domain-containing protein n=1 Tax=Streptomyces sp. NBRC 109706 TaxID=1550035 RepID=UPI0007843A78|nr:Vms1/Ankzf1 family peptidyl-tRNA hydrolase [Streptomyces sp. NBRC 109706]